MHIFKYYPRTIFINPSVLCKYTITSTSVISYLPDSRISDRCKCKVIHNKPSASPSRGEGELSPNSLALIRPLPSPNCTYLFPIACPAEPVTKLCLEFRIVPAPQATFQDRKASIGSHKASQEAEAAAAPPASPSRQVSA